MLRKFLMVVTVGLSLLNSATTWGCLWDSDTLSSESRNKTSVLDALVGRVPVFPKSLYEARIRRLETLNRDYTLAELDDLTVAYDKLGDYANALRFSDLKRKQMGTTASKDDEYRYWANRGTIQVHQALRSKPRDWDLVKSGLEALKKSVEFNPDAHFGREIVQIKLVELISRSADATPKFEEYEWTKFVEAQGVDKVQKGVIGMMELGGGPDQPLLVRALAGTLDKEDASVRFIAKRRYEDLIQSHEDPLKNQWDRLYMEGGFSPVEQELVEAQYRAMVKNAMDYRDLSESYVDQQLNNGKLPETDKNFWKGLKEFPRVNLAMMEGGKPGLFARKNGLGSGPLILFLIFAAFILIVPWALFLIGSVRRAKLEKAEAAAGIRPDDSDQINS